MEGRIISPGLRNGGGYDSANRGFPSPVDSLNSSFDGDSSNGSHTINPSQLHGDFQLFEHEQTPERETRVRFAEDVKTDSVTDSAPLPETKEKKVVKKRKSWGQQLPTPTTNLPPRKRAKTDEEKEQRRIERVLRNRRAASASRERKRLEAEALQASKENIETRAATLHRNLSNERALVIQLTELCEQNGLGDQAFALIDAFHSLRANPPPTPPADDDEISIRGGTLEPVDINQIKAEQNEVQTPKFAYNVQQPDMMAPSTPPNYTYNHADPGTVNPSQLSSPTQSSIDSSPLNTPLMTPSDSDPTLPDMSQHSAEVFDDLPCQSGKERLVRSSRLVAVGAVLLRMVKKA